MKTHFKFQFLLLFLTTFFLVSCDDSDANESTTNGQELFSGQDLSSNFKVSRNLETLKATITVENLTDWAVYAGTDEKNIDYSKAICEGDNTGTSEIELPNANYYFHLISKEGNFLSAVRLLPLNAYNFRDLGGYRTKDGKYTKWGKLFRSGEINVITQQNIDYLASIPLTTIVDFRTAEEIEANPDTKIPTVTAEYALSIEAGNLSILKQMVGKTEVEIEQMSIDLNLDLVTNPVAIKGFKEYFSALQKLDENGALLFHCTAGKDRTGIAAALTLYALGVDEKTIIADYMESNEHLKEKYAAQIEMYPPVIAFFHVREKYMRAAFDKIKEEHESIDDFLKNVLEVDCEILKRELLY